MPKDSGAELGMLFDATVTLYLRLTAAAMAIHRSGPLSGPRRTVLSAIGRSGPLTVAQLARQRAQSRQRLQPLVNALIDTGLVEIRQNPAHRQSPLVALTRKGEHSVLNMAKRETLLRTKLRPASSKTSLTRAAVVLRDVTKTLEQQLPALLRQ